MEANQLKTRLIARNVARSRSKSEGRARRGSGSRSPGKETKAMIPFRFGSTEGQAAQWHKPGRLPTALKEPPPGGLRSL